VVYSLDRKATRNNTSQVQKLFDGRVLIEVGLKLENGASAVEMQKQQQGQKHEQQKHEESSCYSHERNSRYHDEEMFKMVDVMTEQMEELLALYNGEILHGTREMSL
jgi:hypothetical protein